MTAQKKNVERGYLERFLTLIGRSHRVIDSERPDFILVSGGERMGVEVTQALRGTDQGGSTVKREEVLRQRALMSLARIYYRAGGAPVALKMLGGSPPEGPLAAAMAARLIAVRACMVENEQLRLYADEDQQLHPLYLRALPDSFKEYSRWEYLGDTVGWVHTIKPAVLEGIIMRKARHLPQYRRGLARVELLMVADGVYNSGKWQLPEGFVKVRAHGFDAVHLLTYPIEVHTIA